MPKIIDTAQGKTVEYKGKLLYSRYAPQKTSLESVKKLKILDSTLVLCFSPVLGYGLDLLLEKTPESSFVLAIECDEKLMELSKSKISPILIKNKKLNYLRSNNISSILNHLKNKNLGPFRRTIRIDLSSGTNFYKDVYDNIHSGVESYFAQFWKNRITLINLGRNYAKNIFRNLAKLPNSIFLTEQSINKPLLIIAAGPSTNDLIPKLNIIKNDFFIIAVDVVLPILLKNKIFPNAVIVVESQYWIEQSFIGIANSKIPVLADLTARPSILNSSGGDLSFFLSKYSDSEFLNRLASQDFSPFIIPPLGSVGLVALLIARYLTNSTFPVFVSGLDFAWEKGFSHTKGSTQAFKIYNNSNKINPVTSQSSETYKGQYKLTNQCFNTSPSLYNYSLLAKDLANNDYFFNTYKIGNFGLDIGLKSISIEQALELTKNNYLVKTSNKNNSFLPSKTKESIKKFLTNEKQMLLELKSILTNKDSKNLSKEKRDLKILELGKSLDYLYLHFPDAHHGFKTSLDFLKRVRIEIDVFLKSINNALIDLES